MKNVACLVHHHVGQAGPFELGLNVTSKLEHYSEQLEWILGNYQVISLGQLLSGDVPERAILLTFDDGYLSAFDIAKTLLQPRGLPSVFFINPGLLQDNPISLDRALTWACNRSSIREVCRVLGLSERVSVAELIGECVVHVPLEERAAIRDKIFATFGPPHLDESAPLMSRADVKELFDMGAEIGNHTMSHAHCRKLSAREKEAEIGESKARLEEISGRKVRSFAVPYGHENDLPPDVLDYLRATGHEAIFLVHARSNWRRPAPDIWYRTSLHNERRQHLHWAIRLKPYLQSLRLLMTRS